MPRLFQTKIWQARLPDGWQGTKQLFDCATLFKPDGIGQIGVMVCPPESEHPKENPAVTERFSGKLQGFTHTSTGGSSFIRYWWLTCRGRTLIVDYSCSPSFAEVERHEVNEILQSMEESDAPAD
jgi:hypothetical protein